MQRTMLRAKLHRVTCTHSELDYEGSVAIDGRLLRLFTLHAGMRELVAQHRPDVVAMEGVFYAKNVRTSLLLSHARGVLMLAAAEAGVPVEALAPAAVKKAVVGRGRATKAQIGFMVQQLLRLRRPPEPADAADGVAVALACLLTRRPR